MKWILTALLMTTTLGFAAKPRAALSGKILDRDGKPVAHATVLVYHAGVKVGYSTYCPSCYRDCGKRVTTNQNGDFDVQDLAPDLWFTLVAVHDGYLPTISEKVDPEKSAGLKMTLAPRRAVSDDFSIARGRVVDGTGKPVRDALVQPVGLMLGQSVAYGNVPGMDPMAVTNALGDFELAFKGATPAIWVEAEGRGYAPKFAKLATGAPRTQVLVSAGATIRGVLAKNGKPVGNAEVGLIAKERAYELGASYEEQRVGTAPDGSFLISNVPEPVTWLLYGKMSTMPRGEGTQPIEVSTTHEGQYIDKVRLVATAAHAISGRVSLSDGQALPEGMRLTLSAERAWDSQTVPLNRDGTFEIQNVPDGKFCIEPSVRGYKSKGIPNSSCELQVQVAGQDRRDIRVELYPESSRP